MSTGAKANEAWDLQIKALRLSEAGKYAEADPVFKRAIQLEEAQSYRTWTYKLCLLRAVRNYVCQGHYADALPFLDKLYSMYATGNFPQDVDVTDCIFVADCLNDAGEFLMLNHNYKDADPLLAKALKLREILQNTKTNYDRQDRYIDTAATQSAIGRNLIAQKRFSEAQAHLNQAATLLSNNADPTDWLRCEITDAQIKALAGQGKPAPAKLNATAYAFYRKSDFGTTTLWSIYLKAAERNIYPTRKSIDCWWHWKDTNAFFEKALKEAEAFGANDMRLAGTLLKFGSYDLHGGRDRNSAALLSRAIAISSTAGADRLAIASNYAHQTNAQVKYPSISRREDLELLRNEIAAYKRVEGPRSKHAANLCRQYIQLIASIRGLDDRWKAEQYKQMLTDFEQFLSITDPLVLQAMSTCVKQFKSNMQYYDAMILQRKVVAGTKDHYGPRSHEAGVELKLCAELLYETNDLANAAVAAEQATEILGHSPELDAIINPQIREPNPNAHPR
jgi:tetratricopeptide (TPR) repeat protein